MLLRRTPMSIIVQILCWITAIAAAIFAIVSTVLFIKDGIASKREGRRRKKAYTVMFIISIVIIAVAGTAAMISVMLYALASLVMRGM